MINALTVKDATYVTQNLRRPDFEEAECQLEPFDPILLGQHMAAQRYAWCAYARDGTPVMIWGATPISACGLTAWALATDRVREVIRPATRFVRGPATIQARLDGWTWCEARVLTDNWSARRWAASMGMVPVAPLPGYGKGGEHFTLFRWTEKRYI